MGLPKNVVFVVSVVLVSGVACTQNTKEVIDKSLEGTDCIPYVPPRGDRGPGSIFQYRNADGKRIPYPVCENLYAEDRSRATGLSFERRETTATYDVGSTVSLLAGLVKNVDTASANLRVNGIRSTTIQWGRTQSLSLPDEEKFDIKGKLLPISNKCAAALRDLKDKDRLNNVYMVQVAVRVESLLVTANTKGNQELSAGVRLYKLLNLEPTAKWTEKDSRTLEIREPRYICSYPPILLIDFIPTNKLGAESAELRGRSVSNDEWHKLNDR